MDAMETIFGAVVGEPAADWNLGAGCLFPDGFRPDGMHRHDLVTEWTLPACYRQLGNDAFREHTHDAGDGRPERVHCLEWSQSLIAVDVEAVAHRAIWTAHAHVDRAVSMLCELAQQAAAATQVTPNARLLPLQRI